MTLNTSPATGTVATHDGAPDPERVSRRDHARGAVVTLLATAAWVALAAWRPTSTYHFAPLIAAGAWPLLTRRGPLRVAVVDAGRAAAAAGALVVTVGVGLQFADLLRGPTLWGSGAAIVEVPIAAFAGAVAGYRFARCGVPAVPDPEPSSRAEPGA